MKGFSKAGWALLLVAAVVEAAVVVMFLVAQAVKLKKILRLR